METTTETRQFVPEQCEHIKDNGFRCASPAMRGRDFCYYHTRAHINVVPGDSRYEAPVLDTDASVQLTVTHVIRGLLKGKIDRATAHTIFYGIQLVRGAIEKVPTPVHPTHDPRHMAHELTPAMDRLIAQQEKPNSTAGPISNDSTDRWPDGQIASPTNDSGDNVPPALPPDSFASERSLKNDPDEPLLREDRFTPDEVRAYWMQHIQDTYARDLKDPATGTYKFKCPTWLPLSDDEIKYLKRFLPKPGIISTGRERRSLRRLEFHQANQHYRPLTQNELFGLHRPKPTALAFE